MLLRQNLIKNTQYRKRWNWDNNHQTKKTKKIIFTSDMDFARRAAMRKVLERKRKGIKTIPFVMLSLDGLSYTNLNDFKNISQCKLDYRTVLQTRQNVNPEEKDPMEVQKVWDTFHGWATKSSEALVRNNIPAVKIVLN
ncbi:hypothetical protein HDV04_001735 [Boothiomyces sp. JEL0838]|nr:hypothetical protein HDV04_001735 [Boothiomyces sp. JEL0838]